MCEYWNISNMHIYCSNWQAGIYMHPSKGIAKKSSCFITVQSRFWDMDTFPWKWILRSSKIVHSPIECDWIFFSSTVAAVNNGKAPHLIRGVFIHASVCRPYPRQDSNNLEKTKLQSQPWSDLDDNFCNHLSVCLCNWIFKKKSQNLPSAVI